MEAISGTYFSRPRPTSRSRVSLCSPLPRLMLNCFKLRVAMRRSSRADLVGVGYWEERMALIVSRLSRKMSFLLPSLRNYSRRAARSVSPLTAARGTEGSSGIIF